MFSNLQLREIFQRTSGHCHFCGDKLRLGNYGDSTNNEPVGAWEADHVIQRGKGGSKSAANCLPACVRCNRLRWHRKGKQLRELLLLGLVANDEIKKRTETGKKISALKKSHLERNKSRRRRDLTLKN
jgi:5-methylcytosine-specific restriction endonuclease McrA